MMLLIKIIDIYIYYNIFYILKLELSTLAFEFSSSYNGDGLDIFNIFFK